jgi:hypothetical protein
MGRITVDRMIKAIKGHDNVNDLWKIRHATDERLAEYEPERFANKFTNQVVDLASVLAVKYFETGHEPFVRGKYQIKFLVNILDVFSVTLNERAFRRYVDETFEKDLAGAWYQQLRMAASFGMDLRQETPDVAEGIEARLKAIATFLNDGNSIPLREIAKAKLNLENLDIPELGRKRRPTPVTAFILDKTKWLKELHGLKSRGETVERFMAWLETFHDVQQWKVSQHKTADKDTSQELQAYIAFYRYDPAERAETLRQMERDNPGF